MLRPRPHDVFGREHACLVGVPSCASAGNHPVGALALEDGRSLIVSSGGDTHIAARVSGVVVRQLGNLQREVLL